MRTIRECKHCGEEHDLRGFCCRVCKNGLHRYSMTRIDMLNLYESQNKLCLVCDTELEMFVGLAGGVIDHCHETDTVRGILCQQCNIAVGAVENHPEHSKVLEYLGL